MIRFLNVIGLVLGLLTFGALVGMFVDLERITFWAIGLGSGIGMLLIWAPLYLYAQSRARTAHREAMSMQPTTVQPASPAVWGLGVFFAVSTLLFIVSLLQIMVAGNADWANTGIAAFIAAAIAGPLMIVARAISKTPASKPSPQDAKPFVPEEKLPTPLSEASEGETADEDRFSGIDSLRKEVEDYESDPLSWPYDADSEETKVPR